MTVRKRRKPGPRPNLCPHGVVGVNNCVECRRKSNREYMRRRLADPAFREKDRVRVRKRSKLIHYERAFGVTQDFVRGMWEAQDRSCAACGVWLKFPDKHTHLDHCHKTGRIRGLLCRECNQGIGYFLDSPSLLEKAAEYLRRFE